jgi:Lon protease-like protein
MSETPLFPLNTVLFPKTPVQLHIFEDRYKLMIGMCIQEKRPFGVVLIRRGLEALGPLAEPHMVGCMAHIIQVQTLAGGRMNLVALGGERFTIRSLDAVSQPYLVGQVEPFPWDAADPAKLAPRGARLRLRLERLAELLASAGQVGVAGLDLQRLPDDPLSLGCLAAAILQVEPVEKQALLEIADPVPFLDRLLALYRREQALLQAFQIHGDRESGQPFSRN